MKEQAVAMAHEAKNPPKALNLLREYLQALVLRSLHESEAFRPLAFVGGTALRFLYNLPRFSEDLDFSLVQPDGYAGKEWMLKIKRDLALAGFEPEVTWNERKTVHVGWIRIPGLLHEAGLSGMPDEKLAIKLEVDTRPPDGGCCERRIVTRHVTFLMQHYDLPSLMAGKVRAVLVRAKGRDWYDLVWYRSQRPPVSPNIALLQHALDQTQGARRYCAADWCSLVRSRLSSLDMADVARDVAPFLEHPKDAELLTRDNIAALLVAE